MEQKNKQKEESPIAWLFSQVGDKKPYFVMSILLAFLSVISGIMPYFVVAKIVSNLVCGEKDFKVYMMLGVWMTVFFLGKVVFHSISTCLSHGATFAILANIRKKMYRQTGKNALGGCAGISGRKFEIDYCRKSGFDRNYIGTYCS